jgi:hypothetical protein
LKHRSGDARLPRGGAESFCGYVHAASLASERRFISRYHRMTQFVPATCRSLAAANHRRRLAIRECPPPPVFFVALRATIVPVGSSSADSASARSGTCSRTVPLRSRQPRLLQHPPVFSFGATCSAFCLAFYRAADYCSQVLLNLPFIKCAKNSVRYPGYFCTRRNRQLFGEMNKRSVNSLLF